MYWTRAANVFCLSTTKIKVKNRSILAIQEFFPRRVITMKKTIHKIGSIVFINNNDFSGEEFFWLIWILNWIVFAYQENIVLFKMNVAFSEWRWSSTVLWKFWITLPSTQVHKLQGKMDNKSLFSYVLYIPQ